MGRNSQINLSGRRNPKKVIYLACEGGASGTEGTYIQHLCREYNCHIVWIYKKTDTDPLVLAEYAICFSCKQESIGNAEIWIVFDNDEPQKVKEAYKKVYDYNSSLTGEKKYFMPVNIAFNSPSIETFGLLCCKQTKISNNARINQAKLRHPTMPKYSHNKTPNEAPYFDFDTMELGYDFAVKLAKSWQISINDSPEYMANPFAGIYKLTESIKR